MKPVLEHLPRQSRESFVAKYFDYDYYPTPWHYHPEFELVLVTESTGKRFIGDGIHDFAPGDLAFIGPNLPHLYRNDEQYYEGHASLRAKSIVIHFLESSLGHDFLRLPEAEKIQQALRLSQRGLHIYGNTSQRVSKLMHEVLELDGLPRWCRLLEILHILSLSNEYEFISGHAMQGQHEKDSDRLSKVMELVMQSFQKDITLEAAADIANMSAPSFSRYFKQRTRKTFSEFITEIRLGHASRLLQEDQLSVAEVCFQSGFNNLSNFNRQFRKNYNMTPKEFKQQYR